jgi:hypothetical protein
MHGKGNAMIGGQGLPWLLALMVVVGLFLSPCPACEWLSPIRAPSRRCVSGIKLTPIGDFGRPRAPRPKVAAHLHTGIDLCRPLPNNDDEPVFAASCGTVISVRNDGPFAQIIVFHQSSAVWTVYEHVAGIRVRVGNTVDPEKPMARFMNAGELRRYGKQFDHLHFEVLRNSPRKIVPTRQLPERFYFTYGLECVDATILLRRYFDPLLFLKSKMRDQGNSSAPETAFGKQPGITIQ